MTGHDINKTIFRLSANCYALLAALKKLEPSCKEMVSARNSHGNLPIHYVMAYCHGEGILDLVKYIIGLHPECIKATCDARYLPIHVMPASCLYQKSQIETRLFLMKQFPGGLTAENKLGNIPICQAISANCNEILRSMIDAYPWMAKEGWARVNLVDFAIKKKNTVATSMLTASCPMKTHVSGPCHHCRNEKLAACHQCGGMSDHIVMSYLKACGFPMYRQFHVWELLQHSSRHEQKTRGDTKGREVKPGVDPIMRRMSKEEPPETKSHDVLKDLLRSLRDMWKSETELLKHMEKDMSIADLKDIVEFLSQSVGEQTFPRSRLSVARSSAPCLLLEDELSRSSLVGAIVALNKKLSELEG